MKKLFFVLLAVSGTAFGAIDQRIFGSWQSEKPVFGDANVSVFFAFTIRPDSADVSSICMFKNGQSLKATVTISTSVTETHVVMNSTGSNQVSGGGMDCTVSIERGQAPYKITGDNQMSFVDEASGQRMDFIRK